MPSESRKRPAPCAKMDSGDRGPRATSDDNGGRGLFRGLRRGGLGLAAALLLLGDARLLAAQAAQIIELGAAHLAAAHELDRVDHRRIEREYALDAFAVGNLAHRETLVDAAARAADAQALIGLHAGAVALAHLDVHDHGVAWREIGMSLPALSFSICSCSICFNRFMA